MALQTSDKGIHTVMTTMTLKTSRVDLWVAHFAGTILLHWLEIALIFPRRTAHLERRMISLLPRVSVVMTKANVKVTFVSRFLHNHETYWNLSSTLFRNMDRIISGSRLHVTIISLNILMKLWPMAMRSDSDFTVADYKLSCFLLCHDLGSTIESFLTDSIGILLLRSLSLGVNGI